MLFMLGASLFAVSCTKKETQNDHNGMADSANTSGTMSDTGAGTMPMDTAAGGNDSTMNNQGNIRDNQSNTMPNETNGKSGNRGMKTDSAR